MAARSSILNGDFTVYYGAENNRKHVRWTGSSTGTRTLNELYSALQDLFDEPAQMDDLVPIRADTPDIYRFISQWFIDDTSVEHLTGGSLFTDGWVDGTDNHVRLIGYDSSGGTEFSDHDIGRTIVGGTTGDTGTILDFNTVRNLIWIRPDDPTTTGDVFDNGTEAYSVQDDPAAEVWQVDATGPTFTSFTTEFNNATANDVSPFPTAEAAGDYFAVGFSQEFSVLRINTGTGGSGTPAVTWEYWNGTAWTALSGVSDGTSAFTVTGLQDVTWTTPSDWATTSLNGGAELFYVRASLTTGFGATDPLVTQGFIGGVGVGVFAPHARHGAGSVGGEAGWTGITTIGTIADNTHIYIFRESPDQPAQSFLEEKVVASKDTSDWWGDGQLDILLKTKEADSIFGERPAASPTLAAVATVLARQYSKLYSHFIATSLATAGGNTVVPLSAGEDLDNESGYRNLIWDNGSTETLLDEGLLYNVGTTTAGNLDAAVQEDASAGPGFTNFTTEINDSTTNDVLLYNDPSQVNDAFYFGKDNDFTLLLVDIGTAGTGGGVVAWEYWNGATWTALPGTVDDSTSFTAGTGRFLVSWTLPTDWARTSVTSQPGTAPLFYVRARVTTIYTVEPILSIGWVGGEAQLKARVEDSSITTPAGATGNTDYYLIGDPLVDFADNDVVVASGSRKTFDINGAPTDTGPATLTGVTITFGATTENINNGNGARPYSVRIDPNSTSLALVYERLKYVARRGSTFAMDIVDSTTNVTVTQDGEEYVGNELQIEYTGQAGGNFEESQRIFDQTTKAEGTVVADHDDGATGDLILRNVRGTFVAGNVVSGTNTASISLTAALQVDDSPFTVTDFTTEANNATANDVTPFPASEAVNDYFAFGSDFKFGTATINVGTAGVGGVGLWEYWNGSAWTSLEVVSQFSDGTTDFTTGGTNNLVFSPPGDWEKTTVGSFGPYYFIRLRVTTVYTSNPLLTQITLFDLVTATIGSLRTITPVPASPFGTFAGGRFFGAPGVTLTTANLIGADVQAYQLIDDDGVTQVPPNTVAVEVTNLISGDSVAVFRRTGTVINKTQFTLAAGNNLGNTTVVVNEAISADNPTNPNSKIRIVSSNNCEHRYRYDSYSGSTFTLSPASTGTADAGSSSTTLFDAAADFVTDEVEVGDYVYNSTDAVYARIIDVVDLNTLTTDDIGVTWEAKAYSVNTLVENYPTNNNAYVPYIERIADNTSEANQLVQSVSVDVRVVVRNAGVILPFSQDASIGTTGLSIAAIRNPDTIFT